MWRANGRLSSRNSRKRSNALHRQSGSGSVWRRPRVRRQRLGARVPLFRQGHLLMLADPCVQVATVFKQHRHRLLEGFAAQARQVAAHLVGHKRDHQVHKVIILRLGHDGALVVASSAHGIALQAHGVLQQLIIVFVAHAARMPVKHL